MNRATEPIESILNEFIVFSFVYLVMFSHQSTQSPHPLSSPQFTQIELCIVMHSLANQCAAHVKIQFLCCETSAF